MTTSFEKDRNIPNKYGYEHGRPVYEPDADEIALRAAQCRESWSPADYLSRSVHDVPEPVELRPVHLFMDKGDVFGGVPE